MKALFALFLLTAPAMAQAADVGTFATATEVQAALARAKARHTGGNTVEKLVAAPGYAVQLEYRTSDTPPTVHPTENELIEVIGGGCTLVTGGMLAGQKPSQAGAMTVSGTAIQGGAAHPVSKGDYIMVPAGTPHWYKDVRGELVTVALHMPAKP
jgi:hypothetical protein